MPEEQQQQPPNTILQLDTMSLDQLHQLQGREETRLRAFGQRYSVLRSAAARLESSTKAIKDLVPGNGFVPLTESVYVPGTIECHPEEKELLVELGTGYYVEKTQAETIDFLGRKLKLVEANSDNGKWVLFRLSLAPICLSHTPPFFFVLWRYRYQSREPFNKRNPISTPSKWPCKGKCSKSKPDRRDNDTATPLKTNRRCGVVLPV